MENKINLEEMIVKKLDDSFAKKARVETKASIYIAVVSAVLSAIFSNEKLRNLIFGEIAIIIGLIVLLLCMLIIFPREFKPLESNFLENLWNEKPEDSDNQIVKKAKCAICKNEEKLSLIGRFSKLSSLFLMLLIADFMIACIIILFLGE